MAISKSPLGLNARNFIYIREYNPPSAKRNADDKIKTKEILLKNHIPTTKLLAIFPSRQSVRNFDWNLPADGFVIKPARGYGGQGILAFRSWDGEEAISVSGKVYSKKQLESHLFDILDGAYSLQYLPDNAFVEELIRPDPFFRKIAPVGLADIRIIVFNKVPVMAMLRLPTKASDGKANLHMGGVGVGIGLRSGITLNAVSKSGFLNFFPDTKIKARGLKIPDWDKILLLAATTQASSRLGFAGVDIVIDKNRGPLVLEINSRPGLSIQIASNASLRTRLERLEHIDVPTPQRGVELAKNLFVEKKIEQNIDTTPTVLSVVESVSFNVNGNPKTVEAKLDTGAYRTSIDSDLIEELGIPLLKRRILIKAASGQQLRGAVKVDFSLAGKNISTIATVAERAHLQYPIIVGRRNLKGFLINPMITKEKEDKTEEDQIEI